MHIPPVYDLQNMSRDSPLRGQLPCYPPGQSPYGSSFHNIWTTLPRELVNVVLGYDDTIRLRCGKYMNRISKSDSRYLPLFLRPKCRICIWDNYNFDATIINKNGRKFIVTYDIKNKQSLYYYQSLLADPIRSIFSSTLEPFLKQEFV